MSDASEEKGRRARVLLAALALLLLAGAIRFVHLGTWSFWADEVATLRDGREYVGFLGAVARGDAAARVRHAEKIQETSGYPVGYTLIGLVVELLGAGAFVARLLPAIVGALSVPVIYLIGRRLFSHRAGVFAGVFLALSCYHIFFSQSARYYALVVLFGLLGMWAAFLGLERNNRVYLVAAVILLGLAFFTHWSAALLLPALGAYMLWSARRAGRPQGLNLPNVALLFGPFFVGAILAVPKFMIFFRRWVAEWGFSPYRALMVAAKLVYRLEPVLLICAGVGTWLLLRAGDRRAKWLSAFVVVPALLVAVFVGSSEGGSRFGLVSLPAVVLLAAATLDGLLNVVPTRLKKFAWVVLGLVVVSLLVKDIRYFTVEHGQRPRWKEAVQYVMANATEERSTSFIATAPEIFEHYARRPARRLGDLDDASLVRALTNPKSSETWVIVEHVANVAPSPAQMRALKENAEPRKVFPLRVAFLDYSISVFRARNTASRLAPR